VLSSVSSFLVAIVALVAIVVLVAIVENNLLF